MARHFLTLPGEIRNKIYKYALTEDTGIYYHERLSGIGQLFCHTGNGADELQDKQGGWVTKEDEVADDDNNVGLNGSGTRLWKDEGGNKLQIANQLQFVCRQLHEETRALGLQYNTIVFDNKADHKAIAQCAGFLSRLPEEQAKHIRTLAILHEGDWVWDKPTMFQLSQFCTLHPSATIKLHQQRVKPDPNEYFPAAYMLDYCFGKCDLFVGSTGTVTRQISYAIINYSATLEFRLIPRFDKPTNFLVFPRAGVFDDKLFYTLTHNDLAVGNRLLSSFPGGIEAFVIWAKEWSQNGA